MGAVLTSTNVCIACHLLYNYFSVTFQVWSTTNNQCVHSLPFVYNYFSVTFQVWPSVICATSGLVNLKTLTETFCVLKGLGSPDMANRSFHLRAQRSGLNSKGYLISQPSDISSDEEI